MLVSPCEMLTSMRAVPSMLFDMDCQEEDIEAKSSQQRAVQRTQQLLREAADSVSQVSDVLAQLTQQDDLVAASQALGFSVRLRDCVGGGQGAACLHNLRHSFLILSPSSHSSGAVHAEEIIIDPTFKDQFVIAHPSPRYSAVLEALPPVFIGTPSRVQPLVELLCSEMVLAFNAAGIVVPPWRSLRSMMTKWMPRRSLDLPLPASAAAHCASHAGLGRAATATGIPPASNTTTRTANCSTQLLRRACSAADAHTSAGLSCRTTTTHSASSSNCSSTSGVGGGQHAALLQTAPSSVGGDSAAGSPAVLAGFNHPAAAGGGAAGPMEVCQVLPNHKACQAGGRGGRGACHLNVSGQGASRFEPMQRVVGGFGFSMSPM